MANEKFPPGFTMEYRNLIGPLKSAAPWITFLAVFQIISGVLWAVSIVGIIICWVPILLGVILLRVNRSMEDIDLGRADDEKSVIEMNRHLASFFKVQAIFLLVVVVLSVIGVFLLFGSIAVLISGTEF